MKSCHKNKKKTMRMIHQIDNINKREYYKKVPKVIH